jgi:hypothetical protein
VDVLFVAKGLQRWGNFDPKTATAYVHDEPARGDGDLLDLAAVQSYSPCSPDGSLLHGRFFVFVELFHWHPKTGWSSQPLAPLAGRCGPKIDTVLAPDTSHANAYWPNP